MSHNHANKPPTLLSEWQTCCMEMSHKHEPPTWLARVVPRGAGQIVGHFLPILAAAVTLLWYLGASSALAAGYRLGGTLAWVRDLAPALGLVSGFAAWVWLSRAFRTYTTAEHANPRAFEQLKGELRRIRGLLDACVLNNRHTGAFHEARCHCCYVAHYLGDVHASDARWGLANGYLDLWDRLHQAEEVLVPILPRSLVVQGALNDVLRLGGSDIPDRMALLATLGQAVNVLDPLAVPYIDRLRSSEQRSSQPPLVEPLAAACLADRAMRRVSHLVHRAQLRERAEVNARTALRTVRQAINEYRDARWNGLVRMRNQSLCTMSLLGSLLYATIIIATIVGISGEAAALAVAYFLVAATTGVLARMRASASSEFAVEDYGLSNLRLATRPFTSGLAALLGMLAIGLFPLQFTGQTVTIGAIDAAALSNVFSRNWLGTGLLLSAVFGLTPEVVFSNFTRVAEMYGKELKNSRTSEAAATF